MLTKSIGKILINDFCIKKREVFKYCLEMKINNYKKKKLFLKCCLKTLNCIEQTLWCVCFIPALMSIMGALFIYFWCFDLLQREWVLRAWSNAPIAYKFSPSYGGVGFSGVLVVIAILHQKMWNPPLMAIKIFVGISSWLKEFSARSINSVKQTIKRISLIHKFCHNFAKYDFWVVKL